jgi:hypothetical protein
MTAYYFWFGIFMVAAYLIATDASVSYAVTLVSKLLRFQYEKTKWWMLHNPANPIVKWLMWRNALRMAKELEKEFNK